MPPRRSRRPPPPPPPPPSESDASPLPVPSHPPPAAASPSAASSRSTDTSPPPPAAAGRTPPPPAAAGRTPPPPSAASTSRSRPVLWIPLLAAASTSRSPPVPWTPPPAAASTSRSPPLPSPGLDRRPEPPQADPLPSPRLHHHVQPLQADPLPSPRLHHHVQPPQADPLPSPPLHHQVQPPQASSSALHHLLLCSLQPAVAASRAASPPLTSITSGPPLLHDPIPSPSPHHQLQPLQPPPVLPRHTCTPINLPEGHHPYSRPQPAPCEDTEQAVRIEAPPSPNHFPPVSALRPTRLLIKYFLRVDAGGLFHTYPHRGGPFKTLQEAQDAIDSYHINLCKFKYLGGLSNEDRFVWDTLYWRNGTRKNSKEALDAMMNYNPTWEVVKALLDKHNEDHPLEDLAYEMKEVVSYKDHFPRKDSQHECRSFSHLNVLVERGPNAIKDLLFIEMTCTTDGGFEEYVLSCICVVSSDDDGECCECGDDVKHPTGAEYKKGDDVKHPTGAEYKKGVAKGRVQCGRPISREEFNEFIVVRDEDWLEAEEAMVRQQFRTFAIADGHGARGKYIVPAKRVQA